jgi:hypothetical protein
MFTRPKRRAGVTAPVAGRRHSGRIIFRQGKGSAAIGAFGGAGHLYRQIDAGMGIPERHRRQGATKGQLVPGHRVVIPGVGLFRILLERHLRVSSGRRAADRDYISARPFRTALFKGLRPHVGDPAAVFDEFVAGHLTGPVFQRQTMHTGAVCKVGLLQLRGQLFLENSRLDQAL